jgi:hypothetical protein
MFSSGNRKTPERKQKYLDRASGRILAAIAAI